MGLKLASQGENYVDTSSQFNLYLHITIRKAIICIIV